MQATACHTRILSTAEPEFSNNSSQPTPGDVATSQLGAEHHEHPKDVSGRVAAGPRQSTPAQRTKPLIVLLSQHGQQALSDMVYVLRLEVDDDREMPAVIVCVWPPGDPSC